MQTRLRAGSDLMLIAETEGRTDSERMVSNFDFFNRVAHTFLDFVRGANHTEPAYQVRLVKPPSSKSDSPVVDAATAFRYYDLRGRTWERLAFVQARPIAGRVSLGCQMARPPATLDLSPLSQRSDLAGLAAIQRKLQRTLTRQGIKSDRSGEQRLMTGILSSSFCSCNFFGDTRSLHYGSAIFGRPWRNSEKPTIYPIPIE